MIMTKEEFIKAELNTERLTPLQWKGIMNAMDNYAKHYNTEQLLIQRVSQQREQLNDFKNWLVDNKHNIYIYDAFIDEYLESFNCG